MKPSTLLALTLSLGSVDAVAQTGSQTGSLSRSDVAAVSPALERYTTEKLAGGLWKRPGLSPRDRSLITVASLVALYRVNELPFHLKKALDNGLTRDELIEAITHLAFYSGWPTASSALPIAQRIFDEAGV